MILSETPTVHQRTLLESVELDEHTRDGLGAAVQYAYLEIRKHQISDLVLIAAHVLAQRQIECIDRSMPLSDGHPRLTIDLHTDNGFRDGLDIAICIEAPLDHAAEGVRL